MVFVSYCCLLHRERESVVWVELLFFFVCFLLFDTANLSRSEIIMLCVVVVCVMAKVGTVVIISIIHPITFSLPPRS